MSKVRLVVINTGVLNKDTGVFNKDTCLYKDTRHVFIKTLNMFLKRNRKVSLIRHVFRF